MAVIIDPDLLDRDMVVFGTTNNRISLYPVSTQRTGGLLSGAIGVTSSSRTLTVSGADFTTLGVVAGDILVLKNKNDAGHYVVETAGTTTVTVTAASFTGATNSSGVALTDFNGAASVTYAFFSGSAGAIADGITMQCLYSFAKEEWLADSLLLAGDDLIRYPFPVEAITSEQFEIGGGTAHGNWEFFNNYTRKKVRTGGFASKNSTPTLRNEYTGMVTLGSIDADTQVYYQQTSSTTAPTNFTFLGPVNEPITIYDGSVSYKTYLKLFARKKARTYSQSTIGDIGVSSLTTITNRFPLAHALDTAITATDAEILGTAPFRNQTIVSTGYTGTGGVLTASGTNGVLTKSGSTFLGNVIVGDALKITNGTNAGKYFTITNVTNTVITVDNAEAVGDFSSGTVTFEIYTTVIAGDKTTKDLAYYTADTGVSYSSGNKLTHIAGDFITKGVAINDLLIIKDASNSAFNGVYPITNVTATILTVDSTDLTFTSQANIDYIIVEPGMYLQYKSTSISLGTDGSNIAFDNSAHTITKTGGSTTFAAAGITAGSVVVFSNAEDSANIKSFTVASVSGNIITVLSTDTMTTNATDTTANLAITAHDPFKRVIGTTTYGFHWKVTGNGTTLANIYQFVQHQLRQTSDIDWGSAVHRGDVTDLLMSYAAPTGTSLDLYIDNLSSADKNSITLKDATGINRTNPYVASGTISFNTNLITDVNAKFWLFFSTLPLSNVDLYWLPGSLKFN